MRLSLTHALSDVTLGLQFELKELKRKQEEEEEERRRQEELARQAAAPPPQSPDQPTDGYVKGVKESVNEEMNGKVTACSVYRSFLASMKSVRGSV